MTGSLRVMSRPTMPTSREFTERLVFLSSSPLFRALAVQACAEISANARSCTFSPGQVLFMQGERVRSIMVLMSGRVKETQLSADGSEVLIRFTCRGDGVNMQGDSASLEHTCSARATTKCVVLIWELRMFERFLARIPQLRMNINQTLASRVHELEERFLEIATENVECRLQFLLIRLARQIGDSHQLGTQIALRREELAQMIGTSVFTVSRLLSAWSARGLVVPRRESIIIRDVFRLSCETLSVHEFAMEAPYC